MSKENYALLAFNRGMISPLALARIDLKRTSLSEEIMTNWMPRTLGSTMLRPGLKYMGTTVNNAAALHIPFIFSIDDTAIIELTNNGMRIRRGADNFIIFRLAALETLTNETFDSDLTGWTDSDEVGATSSWATGGYMALLGNTTGTAFARRDQVLTIDAGELNVIHSLHVIIARGPVEIRVGTTQGGGEYFSAVLKTGSHSLGYTPTKTSNWIRLQSRETYTVLVNEVSVESDEIMLVETEWATSDLQNVRYDESKDIIFVATKDGKQKQIERRSSDSWSVVDYDTNDGPLRLQNTSTTTLTPSALNGDITITASTPFFVVTHVGALFSIDSTGQLVEATVSAQNIFTDEIRITGVGTSRIFTIIISGRTDSTITLQRSIEVTDNWEDVTSYTANTTVSYDDNLDNQIVYYRIGIKTGDYGTDTVDLTLRFSLGFVTGFARITSFTSETVVNAVVLKNFGGTDASEDWAEGIWSDARGWPTAVAFHEGRLFWIGKGNLLGSVSDSFYSFDASIEGDSGAINRSLGSGPTDVFHWLVSGKTLLAGGDGSIITIRSSSLEEILTPLNVNFKDVSTQGTANVNAVKVDNLIIYVQRSGIRLYELSFEEALFKYRDMDLTSIVPEIGEPSIIKIVVQRQPDTRLHCLRSDGKVGILILDKVEDVKCWTLFETAGSVEDIIIQPSLIEDNVFYVVNRTINESTVRYFEKWTLESENKGGELNSLLDSFNRTLLIGTEDTFAVPHLIGATVGAWAESKDFSTYTVSGAGDITLSSPVTDTYITIGLPYTAPLKNSKGAFQAALGISLGQKKNISQLAVILADTHYQGLQYGPDFDNLRSLPKVKDGKVIPEDTVHATWDQEAFSFPGTWTTDSRLCLLATAPRPCTLLAAIISVNMHEKG